MGESVEGTSIINTAEDNRTSYCRALTGKTLFIALHGTYTITLNELKTMLKASTLEGQTKSPKATGEQITQDEGFKEVRSATPKRKLKLQRIQQCRPKRLSS
jgi:hypothetical protein